MENSSLYFFVLGLVLIAILLGYSLWSARKEKSSIFSHSFSTRPQVATIDEPKNTVDQPAAAFPQWIETPPENEIAQEVEQDLKTIRISLDHQAEQAVQSSPEIAQSVHHNEPAAPVEEPSAPLSVITLYVVAPENYVFSGENIVQQLESHGLVFGEHRIFHRHVDTSASPVLYSAANMVQPGIFDLHQMQHFTTSGLVFFMYLPSAGNDAINLNYMINDVHSIAQHLGGFVLTDEQQIFDENARLAYMQRVQP